MVLDDAGIRERLQLLDGYVQELEHQRCRTLDDLRGDVALSWAIEHGLQLAIQCLIDVCHYLVAGQALGAPATSEEAVELLRDKGVFPASFAEALVRLVRFRNVLVHVYARVDLRRVHKNPQEHLGDFGEFARLVSSFLVRQDVTGETRPHGE